MKKKILIIEDDIDIREVMQDFFQNEGYLVESAENGKVGLEMLHAATELPNVILLDLMMPVMDGYAFREAQKAEPKLSTIPVIIITASGDIEAKRVQLSANDFIKKPIDIDSALEKIARFCL